MTEMNLNQTTTAGSIAQTIEHIKLTRNKFLLNLMTSEGLESSLESQFQTLAISKTKREFLLRDLKELSKAPLDLVHYASLIQEYKSKSDPILDNNPLFFKEVIIIFNKYGFYQP